MWSLTVERYRTLFKPWEDPYLGQTNHNLADEKTAACNFTAANRSPSPGNRSFNPSPRAGRTRDALDPLEHWFGTRSEQGHDGMAMDGNRWRDRHHRVPNVTQYIASWTARQNHPSTLAVEFIFRTPGRLTERLVFHSRHSQSGSGPHPWFAWAKKDRPETLGRPGPTSLSHISSHKP